ncbi:histidine phosphatase family protein [Tepidibacter formicigenes]|jgi:alpha-ribazole phosphatase|uniref:Alpha-ribazole phosphatase n=1 Tax=Tepidibacter formicigenes DSM 15518 TaxID=1123349 RepID=A0A1M6N3M7_9FIRM|nr:histidine phosphatase family protein [Tepidibacter formicigenes]SHJ90294.1 alpha-ribazole phosphatase [Tepidibacter formicigenes DSM 15518]
MVKFIFVRHGITIDNENMRLSGFIDSKLSDIGKEQVKKTCNRLKYEGIDYIYSSPLTRAVETAREIADFKNVEIKICQNFREMNFGDFEGLTFKEIQDKYKDEFNKLKKDAFKYKFPNGENMIEFHHRISSQLDDIIKKHDNETVLIVSHSGVIRSSLSHLLSKDHIYHWNFKIDNCSITIVEVMDNFAVINTLNNIEHLR